MHAAAKAGVKFGAAAVIGTIPSFALLRATEGDKELLGKGHDFWSGAVWGLAAGGLVAAAKNPKALGPLALGWVAGDFIAIGLDSALRGNGAKQAAEGAAAVH